MDIDVVGFFAALRYQIFVNGSSLRSVELVHLNGVGRGALGRFDVSVDGLHMRRVVGNDRIGPGR